MLLQYPKETVIQSGNGLRVSVLDVGAGLHTIHVPSDDGPVPVILNYASPTSYLADPFCVGSTVGPVANRIGGAAFSLNGQRYHLEANETEHGNCLHSGERGLHRTRFETRLRDGGQGITFEAPVADRADGFPGNRRFTITYEFIDDWSLAIRFLVNTDHDTPVNLANHAYFNLGGSIDDHQIRVQADAYLPVGDTLVPTGTVASVQDTPFDLRRWQMLGHRSIDHNFVLRESSGQLRPAVDLRSTLTNLQLSISSTQPGLQVYTGDSLSHPFSPRAGICFEAQGFPDALNQAGFPSTILRAGEEYQQTTVYRFTP